MELDRGEGFFLGPFVVNYTACSFGLVIPAIVLGAAGAISWPAAITIAVLGAVAVPALLYRTSWSWWLMLYFYFLPERLPANGGPTGNAAED